MHTKNNYSHSYIIFLTFTYFLSFSPTDEVFPLFLTCGGRSCVVKGNNFSSLECFFISGTLKSAFPHRSQPRQNLMPIQWRYPSKTLPIENKLHIRGQSYNKWQISKWSTSLYMAPFQFLVSCKGAPLTTRQMSS